MADLLSQLIPTFSGIIGVLIGASIGPLVNHQLTTRYSKKDLIFKRKLDYFEKVLDTIEKNTRLYKQQIKRLESSPDTKIIKSVAEEMKKERKNFLMMSSPLYFDVSRISNRIIHFVKIEKDIFNRVSSVEKINEKEKEILVHQLKRMLFLLERRGNEILSEMKNELKKY